MDNKIDTTNNPSPTHNPHLIPSLEKPIIIKRADAANKHATNKIHSECTLLDMSNKKWIEIGLFCFFS